MKDSNLQTRLRSCFLTCCRCPIPSAAPWKSLQKVCAKNCSAFICLELNVGVSQLICSVRRGCISVVCPFPQTMSNLHALPRLPSVPPDPSQTLWLQTTLCWAVLSSPLRPPLRQPAAPPPPPSPLLLPPLPLFWMISVCCLETRLSPKQVR